MTKRKQYTKEFKLDAVSLVTEQGYSQREEYGGWASTATCWEKEWVGAADQAFRSNGKLTAEQEEIKTLRAQVKRLEMEKEI